MNSRKPGSKLATTSNVSRRKFTFSTDERIAYLKQIQLKKRTKKNVLGCKCVCSVERGKA